MKSDNTNSPNDAEDCNLKWHERAVDYPSSAWSWGSLVVERRRKAKMCRATRDECVSEVVLNVSRQILGPREDECVGEVNIAKG